jgi:ectoine hydroxylase-related dioxygenase (phytanoyl-CoA dioxygenase family)
VVPGSHRTGKADIAAMVAAARTERLPDAVPLVCGPGDVAITNRQAVHGSFANTSPDWRVTVNFGFHRRRSVLGVAGGGIHNAPATYDAGRIAARARVIGWGISARRQRFPGEAHFAYAPHAGETWPWDDTARAEIKDYNLLDLGI